MAINPFSYDTGGDGRGAYHAPAPDPVRSLTTATNVAGAFVSVALIAGIAVWGYDLMVRDVSGVPVVRAATTEMRIRPENPGGQLAQHQGLSVNEIAANGQAAGPADQVVLAPPAVALSIEDQPVLPPRAASVELPAPLAPAAVSTVSTGPQAFDQETTEIDDLVRQLLEEEASDTPDLRPDVDDSPDPLAAEPAVLVETQAAPVLNAPGVRQSARPRSRPVDVRAMIQPAAFTPTISAEIDAAAIPSGTRLAQLGAYDSAEVARAEWQRMQLRFGEMLQNKSRVVQEAQSGGRTFYRLRAMGFVDLNDTRRFCSAVKAEGVDCIPVQVK